jgi:hypothetical protein
MMDFIDSEVVCPHRISGNLDLPKDIFDCHTLMSPPFDFGARRSAGFSKSCNFAGRGSRGCSRSLTASRKRE